MKQYDIIIIGGGNVGLTLANSLADSKLQIAILEQRQPSLDYNHNDYDPRVFAITRASQNIFNNLSLWQAIIKDRASPYRTMHVWDKTGNAAIDFDCRDVGEPELGHIIENRVIQAALHQQLKQHSNISFICPVRLKNYEQKNDTATVTSDTGEKYSAKLIIGADGANSWLRQQAGIELVTWDYGHKGIVATVKTEKPHARCARQCFMPEGPLAFLPLAEPHLSSIVWSTVSARADELNAMSEAKFKVELANAFEFKLGDITEISERISFPLHMRHAKQYVQPRMALVGDAAHTIHPLAGQGVNLGIQDAAALANILIQAKVKHRDIGSIQTLRKYERQRKGHNLKMIAAMEGFKRLFGNTNPVLSWLRNTGVNITNRITPIKHQAIREAMGL